MKLGERDQRTRDIDPTLNMLSLGTTQFKPLNLANLDGVNAMWLFGMFVALAVFVGEVVVVIAKFGVLLPLVNLGKKGWTTARRLVMRQELFSLRKENGRSPECKKGRRGRKKWAKKRKETQAKAHSHHQPIFWSDFGSSVEKRIFQLGLGSPLNPPAVVSRKKGNK
jgi:hypothetical protein